MMKEYNKLVRDKIDEIINTNGKGEIAVIKILNEQKYKEELLKKLDEEKQELKEAVLSGNKDLIAEESADLLEVIKALNDQNLENVLKVMNEKREKRGGFVQRKFLIGVETDGNS